MVFSEASGRTLPIAAMIGYRDKVKMLLNHIEQKVGFSYHVISQDVLPIAIE
jgi:hypothetical protein